MFNIIQMMRYQYHNSKNRWDSRFNKWNNIGRRRKLLEPIFLLSLFLSISYLIQICLAQCPWSKEAAELHSDCICDFNPSLTTNLEQQEPPVNRMSVQCSPVDFKQLLHALKQSASVELPANLIQETLNSSVPEEAPQNSEQLILARRELASQAKLELLHVSNSSIGQLLANSFIADFRTTRSSTNETRLLVVAIQALHLNGCALDRIQPGAFNGLEWSLTSLSLADNRLESLPSEALRKLINLRVLDLSNNRISKLHANAFLTLAKLSILRLADNRLGGSRIGQAPQSPSSTLADPIEANAFKGLERSLTDLNLKNTQLDALPRAVRSLSKLVFLNLAQNQISQVTPRFFEALNALTAINLERNRITRLHELTFFGLENSLSSLSLLGNLLDTFPAIVLAQLKALRRLDLGFNGIDSLPSDAFAHNTQLLLVALDGNPLETLPQAAFKPLEGTLRGLSVGGKALNCDCRLSWMLRWQRELNLQISSRERQPQFCAQPVYLRSLVSFATLKPDHLSCTKSPTTTFSPLTTQLTKQDDAPDEVKVVKSDETRTTTSTLASTTFISNVDLTESASTIKEVALTDGQVTSEQPSEQIYTTNRRQQQQQQQQPQTTTIHSTAESVTTTLPTTSEQQQESATTTLLEFGVRNPSSIITVPAGILSNDGNGISILPEDELFALTQQDQQRKINRQGYLLNRLDPLRGRVNLTTATTTYRRNPNQVIHHSEARRNRPIQSVFGNRAQSSNSSTSTLLLVTQKRLVSTTPTPRLFTEQSTSGSQLQVAVSPISNKAGQQQTLSLVKGARFMDDSYLTAPGTRISSIVTPTRVPISNITSLDNEPTVASEPQQTTLDLERFYSAPQEPPIPHQNNTRMSVSSMYRLSSIMQQKFAANSSSNVSLNPPIVTNEASTELKRNLSTLKETLKPKDATSSEHSTGKLQQLGNQSEGTQPIVYDSEASTRMATSIRMVESRSSSPVSSIASITPATTMPTVEGSASSQHPTSTSTIISSNEPNFKSTIASTPIPPSQSPQPTHSFKQQPTDMSFVTASVGLSLIEPIRTPHIEVTGRSDLFIPTTATTTMLTRNQHFNSPPSITSTSTTTNRSPSLIGSNNLSGQSGQSFITEQHKHDDATRVNPKSTTGGESVPLSLPTVPIKHHQKELEMNSTQEQSTVTNDVKAQHKTTRLHSTQTSGSKTLSLGHHQFRLPDLDHLALILAALLCAFILVLALSIICICCTKSDNQSSSVKSSARLSSFSSDESTRPLGRNQSGSPNCLARILCCWMGTASSSIPIPHGNSISRERALKLLDDDSNSSGASTGAGSSNALNKSAGNSMLTSNITGVTLKHHELLLGTLRKDKLAKEGVVSRSKLEGELPTRPLDHIASARQHRRALLADRESGGYFSGGITSPEPNDDWLSDKNHPRNRSPSSSCDSDKSFSPGANRNNHYRIHEAHRAYLSGANQVNASMFLSTSTGQEQQSRGRTGKEGTYFTSTTAPPSPVHDYYTDLGEQSATVSAGEDSCPAPVPGRGMGKNRSKATGRRRERLSVPASRPQEPNSMLSVHCYPSSNADLVPMSAEAEWPEPPYDVDPGDEQATHSYKCPESRQLVHFRPPEGHSRSHQQHHCQPFATMHPSRNSATGRRARVRTNEQHLNQQVRLRMAYDDAYLTNWHTVNRRTRNKAAHERSLHQRQLQGVHPSTSSDEPAQTAGALLRYRSIPSLSGQTTIANNWLRYAPQQQQVELPGNSETSTSNSQQASTLSEQQQLNNNRASWHRDNHLETLYVASNQAI